MAGDGSLSAPSLERRIPYDLSKLIDQSTAGPALQWEQVITQNIFGEAVQNGNPAIIQGR